MMVHGALVWLQGIVKNGLKIVRAEATTKAYCSGSRGLWDGEFGSSIQIHMTKLPLTDPGHF